MASTCRIAAAGTTMTCPASTTRADTKTRWPALRTTNLHRGLVGAAATDYIPGMCRNSMAVIELTPGVLRCGCSSRIVLTASSDSA